MTQVVLSQHDQLVVDSELVSPDLEKDRWQVVSYETAEVSGRMLVAGECTFPDAIELHLNVTGWHRIHLGLAVFGMLPMKTSLEIGLSGERLPTIVSPAGFARAGTTQARRLCGLPTSGLRSRSTSARKAQRPPAELCLSVVAATRLRQDA